MWGNAMEIWIKEEGNESSVVQLPVLPSSFEMTKTRNHQTVEVNKKGTINLIGKRGLHSIPITSFFPVNYNKTFCNVPEDDLKAPYEYVKAIEKLMGKVCRVVITDTNIDMLCLINTFNYSETDGSGDVTFTLELSEYRPVEVTRTKIKTSKTYKTKDKDTLKKIAKKKLKDSKKWKDIYNKNKKKCKKAWKNIKYVAQNKKKNKANKLMGKGIKLTLPS